MPSESALLERARALVVAMHERDRYIYALAPGSAAVAAALLDERGIPKVEEEGPVAKYGRGSGAPPQQQSGSEPMRIVLFDAASVEHGALDVVLLEGHGAAAVEVVRAILERTGFVPQSRLLATAYAIPAPEATRALRVLAHMVVAWDEDWLDLFLLHLASPDPLVRKEALAALTTAALVAHDAAPALEILREAKKREKFPKLAETIGEAIALLEAAEGGIVDLAGSS